MWIFEYKNGGGDEAESLEAFLQSWVRSTGDWGNDGRACHIVSARWESADGACCWVTPQGITAINMKLDEISDNECVHRYNEGAYRDAMGDWRW